MPYTFVICVLCVALWRAVRVAEGDLDPFGPQFSVGLFDCWATHPMRTLQKNFSEIGKLFIGFVQNIALAPWTVAKVQARLNDSDKVWAYAIPLGLSFALCIILHILELVSNGCWAIAWFFYLAFVAILASVRIQVRDRLDINGNAFEDFFAALFFYPNVALQVDLTTRHLQKKKAEKEVDLDAENGAVNKGFES